MLRNILFLFSFLIISAIAEDKNFIIYDGGSNIRYQGSDPYASGGCGKNKCILNQVNNTPFYNDPIYSIPKTSNRTGGTYVRPDQPANPIQPYYPGAASPNTRNYTKVVNSKNSSVTKNSSVNSLGSNSDASTIPLENDLEPTNIGHVPQDNDDNMDNTTIISQHNKTIINTELDPYNPTKISVLDIDPYTNSSPELELSTAKAEVDSNVYPHIDPIHVAENDTWTYTQPILTTSRPGNIGEMYTEPDPTIDLESSTYLYSGPSSEVVFTTLPDIKSDPTPSFQVHPQDESTRGPKIDHIDSYPDPVIDTKNHTETNTPPRSTTSPEDESQLNLKANPTPFFKYESTIVTPSVLTPGRDNEFLVYPQLSSTAVTKNYSLINFERNSFFDVENGLIFPKSVTASQNNLLLGFQNNSDTYPETFSNVLTTPVEPLKVGSNLFESTTSKPLREATINEHFKPNIKSTTPRTNITEVSAVKPFQQSPNDRSPNNERSGVPPNDSKSPTTKQPILTIDLKNFTCSQRYGYYSIAADQCDTYVECKNKVPRRRICPDGLHFNPKTMYPEYPCSFPADVKCIGNEFRKNHQPTSECPRQFGFFAAIDGNSSNYRLCQNGKATILQCPLGLAFNEVISICDWPGNVTL